MKQRLELPPRGCLPPRASQVEVYVHAVTDRELGLTWLNDNQLKLNINENQ